MSFNKPLISIVSPVYRAEKIIDDLDSEIIKSVSPITADFEIILIEDSGPDNSWKKIEENCHKELRVKGIKLSRNFSQHYAMIAFSDKPLWLMVKFGAIISFISFLIGLAHLIQFLTGKILEPGFTSLILSIYLAAVRYNNFHAWNCWNLCRENL